MKFKKSQSGRSMVEMLGVLAIIGVLSVGGIAGYSLSMRRHRANQVVDIASKFAVVVYNTCQQELLNGEITDLTGCSSSDASKYFSNAGIGDALAGVDISYYDIKTDPDTGVDTITILTAFDDKKLCQAVASVAGTVCDGWTVAIRIKQN